MGEEIKQRKRYGVRLRRKDGNILKKCRCEKRETKWRKKRKKNNVKK